MNRHTICCILLLPMLSFIHLSYGEINNAKKVRLLTLKNKKIAAMLGRYFGEQMRFTTEDSVVVLKVEKAKSGVELRVGSVSFRMLSSLMCRTKDKLYGYIKHKNAVVFVFGTCLSEAFSRTKTLTRFDFVGQPQQRQKRRIPTAPVIYEPVVWILKYQDDSIKLVDKGRFSLL